MRESPTGIPKPAAAVLALRSTTTRSGPETVKTSKPAAADSSNTTLDWSGECHTRTPWTTAECAAHGIRVKRRKILLNIILWELRHLKAGIKSGFSRFKANLHVFCWLVQYLPNRKGKSTFFEVTSEEWAAALASRVGPGSTGASAGIRVPRPVKARRIEQRIEQGGPGIGPGLQFELARLRRNDFQPQREIRER